jgi:hypothetical protein
MVWKGHWDGFFRLSPSVDGRRDPQVCSLTSGWLPRNASVNGKVLACKEAGRAVRGGQSVRKCNQSQPLISPSCTCSDVVLAEHACNNWWRPSQAKKNFDIDQGSFTGVTGKVSPIAENNESSTPAYLAYMADQEPAGVAIGAR